MNKLYSVTISLFLLVTLFPVTSSYNPFDEYSQFLYIQELEYQLDSLWGRYDVLLKYAQDTEGERKALGREVIYLQERYDVWRQHAEVEPQSRSEYYLYPLPLVNQLRVVFPDAVNCMKAWVVSDTGSMKPLLGEGTEVVGTSCFIESDIGVGDLIVFSEGGEVPTLHQIIGVEDGGFVTKGIYNVIRDPFIVMFEDILAVIVVIVY